MCRKLIIIAISVIMAATIIFIAGQYHEAVFDKAVPFQKFTATELERYKERLEGTVSDLRNGLAYKRNELAGLDRELGELEAQYNILIEESKRIADRLEALKGAQ